MKNDPRLSTMLRLSLFFVYGMAVLAQGEPSSDSSGTVVPLFADLKYESGFSLSFPTSKMGRKAEAVLNFGDESKKPVWRLCQWGTRHTLAGSACIHRANGDRVYENRAKRVLVAGAASEHRDLILDVNARKEYSAARKRGEAWPHLLIEQDATRLLPLSELDAIRLSVDVKLLKCKPYFEADYDPSLHAAQFQLFLVVRNIDPEPGDSGGYFWFGVPFFDNRHEMSPGHKAKDGGKDDATGQFIYSIAARQAFATPVKDGNWVHVDTDLLPQIKAGLELAVARGYLASADVDRYAVVNMNMGWEVPGVFDVSMQVRDLQLNAVLKGTGQDKAVREPNK